MVDLETATPGTYVLLSIDGDSLPYLFEDNEDGFRTELVFRDLTLLHDRSSLMTSRYRNISPTDTSFVETGDGGSWWIAEGEIQISFTSGRNWEGTLLDEVLRLIDGNGTAFIFRR